MKLFFVAIVYLRVWWLDSGKELPRYAMGELEQVLPSGVY
jgi:hypothetical protein